MRIKLQCHEIENVNIVARHLITRPERFYIGNQPDGDVLEAEYEENDVMEIELEGNNSDSLYNLCGGIEDYDGCATTVIDLDTNMIIHRRHYDHLERIRFSDTNSHIPWVNPESAEETVSEEPTDYENSPVKVMEEVITKIEEIKNNLVVKVKKGDLIKTLVSNTTAGDNICRRTDLTYDEKLIEITKTVAIRGHGHITSEYTSLCVNASRPDTVETGAVNAYTWKVMDKDTGLEKVADTTKAKELLVELRTFCTEYRFTDMDEFFVQLEAEIASN